MGSTSRRRDAAGFNATVNQLEKLAEALRKGGFIVLEQ